MTSGKKLLVSRVNSEPPERLRKLGALLGEKKQRSASGNLAMIHFFAGNPTPRLPS